MVSVASIFQDVSTTTATHRKNINSFLKLSKSDQIVQEFTACLLHLLDAKKDIVNSNNVLLFLNSLFTEINDQEYTLPDDFHEQLIHTLLLGIQASNKDVRARSSQILAMYMNIMDEVSEDCLESIKTVAMERIYDKNASVRINSVICLCRLQVLETD
jgi:condensin complex subunit 3